MRILSLLIFCFTVIFLNKQTDSPHGAGFKVSCKSCHSPKGWQLDKSVYSFNHNKTDMPLVGQHSVIDCRQCHVTLIFKDAKTECNQCHTDIHQSMVGPDCSRCHTPVSWLVNNVNEIHQRSRFPLLGAHRTADCIQCHKSEALTRFDVNGVNCIDCHRDKYMATTSPNHIQSGISEDCSSCHQMTSFQWTGAGFDHSLFPLTQGHSTVKCADCHTSGNLTSVSPLCYSCHQKDFLATNSPNHSVSQIQTTCQDCHTLAAGWKPVTFDHTSFPLKLGHAVPTCIDCHTGGNYTSTPADCYSCHQKNYSATTNPNHTTAGIPTACLTCHTVNPGWKPAKFNHTTFALTIGHATPTCADCHKGNYTTTPTDCYSCHSVDYNNSNNPNHSTLAFSTVCTQCHTTTPGWKPATYAQHDTQFPIYSGRHKGKWSLCTDCHTNTANYAQFSCASCHSGEHRGSNYTPAQCLNCHPKG
ncbi:MAG: hypothetical protein WCS03_14275 [Bacteroidota bacterium]